MWHVHAKDYVKVAKELGHEVCAVYDENREWSCSFAQTHGLSAVDSLEELLQSDIEGVIVCSATNRHTEDIISIAEAKKHIFTEKVLALSVEDCDKIADAVNKNGVNFVISMPFKSYGAVIAAKKVLDSGELGAVRYFRFRNVHNGSTADWLPPHFYSKEQCGGGAMIDLGAHGMYVTDWFLGGTPDSYASQFTDCTGRGVEDNAVTVMAYKNGAIAVNETGFVFSGTPRIIDIGGEKGRLHLSGDDIIKVVNGEQTTVAPEPNAQSPLSLFLSGGQSEQFGLAAARRLTEMMQGAYKGKV